ncbi:MAG: hypothetical protein M3Y05_15335 [Gemmatimonadota bacterium]|nr:hypothetical protein [Gemmatimonadota bacterium]
MSFTEDSDGADARRRGSLAKEWGTRAAILWIAKLRTSFDTPTPPT